MSNKRILVTGGTGYIGSHTVVELLAQNYEVVIADNLSRSSIDVLENIKIISGKTPIFEKVELCDKAETEKLFDKYKSFDAVIHFAAYKAVGESVGEPLLYYYNNIFSLVNLLNAMKKHDVKNIVFSSSCTVYGQPDKLPVTEASPKLKAESPYGNTKQMSEDILFDTAKCNVANVIALRYFNPVGAHPSAKIGELPLGVPNNLVPFITQTAIGKRECLNVFGNDYNTHDGTCIRDFIHVVDLAKAHVNAVHRLMAKEAKSNYEAFNVGTGNGATVLDAIKAFEKATGEKLNWKFAPRRAGDVEQIYADTSFAEHELKWKAMYSLEDAMLHQWNWEKTLQ